MTSAEKTLYNYTVSSLVKDFGYTQAEAEKEATAKITKTRKVISKLPRR